MFHEELENDGFKGRIKELEKIKRYKQFDVMFYRSDLVMHSTRMRLMLDNLSPQIRQVFPSFDFKTAGLLVLVHDDPETVSKKGDVPYSVKLRMSPEDEKELEIEESRAIEVLSSRWPIKIKGIEYKKLLLESHRKETLESQMLSYIDKMDALCESIHEVIAGNEQFYKRVNESRPPYRGTQMLKFPKKYPNLTPFYQIEHPIHAPLNKFKMPDPYVLLRKGRPHTSESIRENSNIPHYEYWKRTLLEGNPEQGLDWLIKQREFKI